MNHLLFESVLVPVISIIATVLVIILAYVAQMLARAGDLIIEVKRQAFLDAREVRLGIRFYSTKKKSYEFHDIVLAAVIEGKLTVISDEAPAPVTFEDATNLKTSEHGYQISIKEGIPFDGVFRFHIPREVPIDTLKGAYLLARNKEGKAVKAYFLLNSTETQEITFVRA